MISCFIDYLRRITCRYLGVYIIKLNIICLRKRRVRVGDDGDGRVVRVGARAVAAAAPAARRARARAVAALPAALCRRRLFRHVILSRIRSSWHTIFIIIILH